MTRILVTNDDGIFSEGIKVLAQELSALGEVTVVAPDREQSASDCVNLAIMWLMEKELPDLIVSGINFGMNLGDDVTYSGTVSAAFEGSLLGIPSVAFSQEVGKHFSFGRGARIAADIMRRLAGAELPEGLLLNVNFPAVETRGVRWTRLGQRRYLQTVIEKTDPRGRKYYWIAGSPEWQDEDGTDHAAISAGFVSITPLHLDLTDYEVLARKGRIRGLLDGVIGEPEP